MVRWVLYHIDYFLLFSNFFFFFFIRRFSWEWRAGLEREGMEWDFHQPSTAALGKKGGGGTYLSIEIEMGREQRVERARPVGRNIHTFEYQSITF